MSLSDTTKGVEARAGSCVIIIGVFDHDLSTSDHDCTKSHVLRYIFVARLVSNFPIGKS